jgi:thiamine biosynthesis lipoprotein
MGTHYTAKVVAPGLTPTAQAAAREAVRLALETVSLRMSTYRTDSELTRLNRYAEDAPFALSPDTLAVFELAQRVSERSGGAFDVTVGPVVDAWGFGPSKLNQVPSDEALRALGARVGYRMLTVDARAGSVAKAHPDVRADLSGIAKGFGVDQAARALEALGFGDYLIEAGGEVRTRGLNAHGEPWRIGIERPDALPPRVHCVVPLSGRSMATSGDYRIYFEQAGRRYSHEIDPRTGAPIRHGLASVTVVAPECGFADAMATALIVLGPEQGLALAEREALAAYFIVREPDGGFSERQTSAFAALGPQTVRG